MTENSWNYIPNLKIISYSMKEGKYTSLLPRSGKLVYGSDFHYGTDLVFSTHASPVVPKDSPLKVLVILKF